MDPIVGAQYRWSAAFAPRWNRFWGLMQGWITVFAWICSAASNPALITNIAIGLAEFDGGYALERWHATLIMCFVTLVTCVGNLWLPRFLNGLEAISAIIHVAFFVACIATLAALANKSAPTYVFGTLTHDISGWDNPGVAWGLGLITVTYPLTGKQKSSLTVLILMY
ncbi:hypothetical protein NX059_010745 [Plenodomus lindquistii]|nr:hypothetical protein NX059_010745 [Plenodomus lindquistii]